MPTVQDKIELVRKNIKNYPDFPKPGILFRDVFSVMNNPESAEALHDLFISHCSEHIPKIQAICALDSRGFLFGPLIANHFHIPFVPIRKKGKLPGNIKRVSYDLEYGSETFEIQTDALKPGSNVLLVDDLLATGVQNNKKPLSALRELYNTLRMDDEVSQLTDDKNMNICEDDDHCQDIIEVVIPVKNQETVFKEMDGDRDN